MWSQNPSCIGRLSCDDGAEGQVDACALHTAPGRHAVLPRVLARAAHHQEVPWAQMKRHFLAAIGIPPEDEVAGHTERRAADDWVQAVQLLVVCGGRGDTGMRGCGVVKVLCRGTVGEPRWHAWVWRREVCCALCCLLCAHPAAGVLANSPACHPQLSLPFRYRLPSTLLNVTPAISSTAFFTRRTSGCQGCSDGGRGY